MKPIVGFALVLCTFLTVAFAADEPQAGKQEPEKFEKQVTIHLDYLAYVPKDYDKDPSKKWPLIVFLHGAGERGTDIEKVKVHGPPKIAEAKELPFVIVSPQCPPDRWWDVPVLSVWLDEVMTKYHVEPDRMYLT